MATLELRGEARGAAVASGIPEACRRDWVEVDNRLVATEDLWAKLEAALTDASKRWVTPTRHWVVRTPVVHEPTVVRAKRKRGRPKGSQRKVGTAGFTDAATPPDVAVQKIKKIYRRLERKLTRAPTIPQMLRLSGGELSMSLSQFWRIRQALATHEPSIAGRWPPRAWQK